MCELGRLDERREARKGGMEDVKSLRARSNSADGSLGLISNGEKPSHLLLPPSIECGWEVIYPVLGPIPNGAGTMVLRGVFLFL